MIEALALLSNLLTCVDNVSSSWLLFQSLPVIQRTVEGKRESESEGGVSAAICDTAAEREKERGGRTAGK